MAEMEEMKKEEGRVDFESIFSNAFFKKHGIIERKMIEKKLEKVDTISRVRASRS